MMPLVGRVLSDPAALRLAAHVEVTGPAATVEAVQRVRFGM
jgi:hypothetical protein